MKRCTVLLTLWVAVLKMVYSQDGFATLEGGTTGGAGGSIVEVCTESEFTNAVADDIPRIVRVMCEIPLKNRIEVGSNKSILGGMADAAFSNNGLIIKNKKNIIIRGLHFCCAYAPNDGVTIDESTNVWIDHNEFYSDMDHHEDYFDGLLDVINGADFITVSWNSFHDHWKTSLIGRSDDVGYLDEGRLHLTYHHNYFRNCNSRAPSVRFGVVHIFNNLYHSMVEYGINSRMGAQVLVEGNVFRNTTLALTTSLYSREDGYAVERNNDYGGADINITQVGNFTRPPYPYRIDRVSKIPYLVERHAGPTILF